MSCFLFTEDNDVVSKVNIDDLYEKKQKRDQSLNEAEFILAIFINSSKLFPQKNYIANF